MTLRTTAARLGATTAAAGVVVIAAALPASAHVTVSPSDTGAGAYTVLTFSVPHGCDGSPTTKIAIQIPDSLVTATPTRNPFYDISTKTEKLDPPQTAEDGDEITERTSEVIYTAKTPLPADQRDTLELSIQLPDTAGETITFPTVQTCEQGETAWTEVPADGQTADDLEHPAPAFEITDAMAGDMSHGSDSSDSSGSSEEADEADDSDGNGLAIAGLVAGVLGLLAGGAALARSGRKE